MSRHTLFTILICITACTSCNFAVRKGAVVINNTIVAINDSLYDRGKGYSQCVERAIIGKEFALLKPTRRAFERFIDSGISVVQFLQNEGGSENLKNAELQLLKLEKTIISSDFLAFDGLTIASTDNEIAAIFENMKQNSRLEADQVQKLNELQREYAKSNGLKLESRATVSK